MSSCSYHLEELDLSSCLLTHDMLQMLWPAFKHTHNLKWDKLNNCSVVVCSEDLRITKEDLSKGFCGFCMMLSIVHNIHNMHFETMPVLWNVIDWLIDWYYYYWSSFKKFLYHFTFTSVRWTIAKKIHEGHKDQNPDGKSVVTQSRKLLAFTLDWVLLLSE